MVTGITVCDSTLKIIFLDTVWNGVEYEVETLLIVAKRIDELNLTPEVILTEDKHQNRGDKNKEQTFPGLQCREHILTQRDEVNCTVRKNNPQCCEQSINQCDFQRWHPGPLSVTLRVLQCRVFAMSESLTFALMITN